jgi:hypothetical protein
VTGRGAAGEFFVQVFFFFFFFSLTRLIQARTNSVEGIGVEGSRKYRVTLTLDP